MQSSFDHANISVVQFKPLLFISGMETEYCRPCKEELTGDLDKKKCTRILREVKSKGKTKVII